MAKRDLIRYYKDCTKQYSEMLTTLNNVTADESANLSEELLDTIAQQVDIMRTNCDRLGYAIYLLQKPVFKLFRKKYDDTSIVDYFKRMKADNLSVFSENKIAFNIILDYINNNNKELTKHDK